MIDFGKGNPFDFEPEPDAKTVEAECFILRDRAGTRRGMLGVDSDGNARLSLHDEAAQNVVLLSASSRGTSCYLQAGENHHVAIRSLPGQLGIIVEDERSDARVVITLQGGQPAVVLTKGGKSRVITEAVESE